MPAVIWQRLCHLDGTRKPRMGTRAQKRGARQDTLRECAHDGLVVHHQDAEWSRTCGEHDPQRRGRSVSKSLIDNGSGRVVIECGFARWWRSALDSRDGDVPGLRRFLARRALLSRRMAAGRSARHNSGCGWDDRLRVLVYLTERPDVALLATCTALGAVIGSAIWQIV